MTERELVKSLNKGLFGRGRKISSDTLGELTFQLSYLFRNICEDKYYEVKAVSLKDAFNDLNLWVGNNLISTYFDFGLLNVNILTWDINETSPSYREFSSEVEDLFKEKLNSYRESCPPWERTWHIAVGVPIEEFFDLFKNSLKEIAGKMGIFGDYEEYVSFSYELLPVVVLRKDVKLD